MVVSIQIEADEIEAFKRGNWVPFNPEDAEVLIAVQCDLDDVSFGVDDDGNPVVRRIDLLRNEEKRRQEDLALRSLP